MKFLMKNISIFLLFILVVSGVCSTQKVMAMQPAYAKLTKKLDASFYLTDQGQLYVQYIEKYAAGDLDYAITDKTGAELINENTLPIAKLYGSNWIHIDLSAYPGFVNGDYYVLKITNDKNQKEYLKIRYWN